MMVQLIQEEDDRSPPGRPPPRMFFMRSSNSPRYLVPAMTEGRSRASSRFWRRASGTCPQRHFSGPDPRPTAVLPTPAPPEDGVVFPRRMRDWMTWRTLLPAGDGVIAAAAGGLDHVLGVLVQQPGGGGGGGRRKSASPRARGIEDPLLPRERAVCR